MIKIAVKKNKIIKKKYKNKKIQVKKLIFRTQIFLQKFINLEEKLNSQII